MKPIRPKPPKVKKVSLGAILYKMGIRTRKTRLLKSLKLLEQIKISDFKIKELKEDYVQSKIEITLCEKSLLKDPISRELAKTIKDSIEQDMNLNKGISFENSFIKICLKLKKTLWEAYQK